jgi:hypothetical protein
MRKKIRSKKKKTNWYLRQNKRERAKAGCCSSFLLRKGYEIMFSPMQERVLLSAAKIMTY